MRPPILVFTNSEPLIFKTIEDAEGYMEPIDVQRGEYVAAFDADGARLSIEAQLHGGDGSGMIVPGGATCLRDAGETPDPVGAAERLRAYLHAPGEGSGSLAELVTQAIARWGYCR